MNSPWHGRTFLVHGAEVAEEGELSARIEVPAGSRLCDGHFPGRPIVPGIAHLAFLSRAWELATGGEQPARVLEVPTLRLRHPVFPADRLELAARQAGPTLRFTLRRRDQEVSQGTVVLAPAADPQEEPPAATDRGAPPPADPAGEASPGPPSAPTGGVSDGEAPDRGSPELTATPATPATPAIAAIPHRPPALLVLGQLEPAAQPEEGIACRAWIPGDHPLAGRGVAPGYLALEAAAQAAALLAAGKDPAPPQASIAYLVGVREAQLAPRLPLEAPFLVTVRPAGDAPPLARYTVRAELGDQLLARGTLSLWLPG